jgi:3-oxoacyl-[acyl-carrier-protein] synthase-1
MRAGIAGFAELPYKDDAGLPIIGAAVADLPAELSREERLIQLLEPAIRECIIELDLNQLERIPLLVGLAESELPGGSPALADLIVPEIERRLGVRFLERCSRAIATGRTAGFEALHEARGLLQTRGVEACVISGVDSYINARVLHWLGRHWRLKHERNSDGVIPGEAAAAAMLRTLPDTNSGVPARLIGLGFATEQATVMTEEAPLLGLGLTAASKAALSEAGVQMHEIGVRLSDVTGESYGFREQALVVGRLLRVHREEGYPIWHASECIGDTGSAAGIIQLIMAFHAYQKDYAPGEVAMCFTSADSGRRAVAVLAPDVTTRWKRST